MQGSFESIEIDSIEQSWADVEYFANNFFNSSKDVLYSVNLWYKNKICISL